MSNPHYTLTFIIAFILLRCRMLRKAAPRWNICQLSFPIYIRGQLVYQVFDASAYPPSSPPKGGRCGVRLLRARGETAPL